MNGHSIWLRCACLLLAVFASRTSSVIGKNNPNTITTLVNANSCFAKRVHGTPEVFCVGGFSGDGGPAKTAKLSGPKGIVVDGSGNLFIADNGNRRVRRVDANTGIVTTVAGNSGCAGACKGGFSGDGGPAIKAE